MKEEILKYLVGLLTFGISQRRIKDRKVFEKLISELPPDSPAILLLKDHDMGAPFRYEIMAPLQNAHRAWSDVDKTFQSRGVEKRKADFLSKLEEFLSLFRKKSGNAGDGWISIGIKDYEDRPEMKEYRDELNKLGTEAFEKYNEFYRYAHKKLPV